MEELRRQIIFLLVFVLVLSVTMLLYKSVRIRNFFKGDFIQINSSSCVKLSDGICLSEDAGISVDYYSASTYCRKRGMHLPTREEAWTIWINSENCDRVFASNLPVPKDKNAFMKICSDDTEDCIIEAMNVPKYCTTSYAIKFPRASQYENGYFWLKDSAESGKHYSINYFTGNIKSTPDINKTLGIRCVKRAKS